MRTLRRSIIKQQFYIQFSGTEYEVAQKPVRTLEGGETCSTGQVFQDGKCGESGAAVVFSIIPSNAIIHLFGLCTVSCGAGTFYSGEQEQCVQCPPGTYQDMEGQLTCEPCPSTEGQGIVGAKNVSQCGGKRPSPPQIHWCEQRSVKTQEMSQLTVNRRRGGLLVIREP